MHHFLPADAGHATELLARFAFLNSTPTLAMLQNHISYIIVRLLIGFGLATFVCCQFWTSIMFAPTVVGMANAISGGWGNAGQQPRLRLSVDTMIGDCATTLLSTGSCSLLRITGAGRDAQHGMAQACVQTAACLGPLRHIPWPAVCCSGSGPGYLEAPVMRAAWAKDECTASCGPESHCTALLKRSLHFNLTSLQVVDSPRLSCPTWLSASRKTAPASSCPGAGPSSSLAACTSVLPSPSWPLDK